MRKEVVVIVSNETVVGGLVGKHTLPDCSDVSAIELMLELSGTPAGTMSATLYDWNPNTQAAYSVDSTARTGALTSSQPRVKFVVDPSDGVAYHVEYLGDSSSAGNIITITAELTYL